MDTKHKEYIEGKPQLGDRSREHPGCSAYMDLAYFNAKSSLGKPRAQARPRFLERHDDVWTNWIKKMREEGLTNQDVLSATSKQRSIIGKKITEKFKDTCPNLRRKADEPNCMLHYEYCPKTERLMSEFYLLELAKLPIPSSSDMFTSKNND